MNQKFVGPTHLRPYMQAPSAELREFLVEHLHQEIFACTLVCSCGNSGFMINIDRDEEVVTISCPICDTSITVYDSVVHGWDGYYGNRERRAELRFQEYICKCAHPHHNIAAGFEYPDDEDGVNDDTFSWIIIAGKCLKCNTLEVIISSESA